MSDEPDGWLAVTADTVEIQTARARSGTENYWVNNTRVAYVVCASGLGDIVVPAEGGEPRERVVELVAGLRPRVVAFDCCEDETAELTEIVAEIKADERVAGKLRGLH
jgi:hypothetical protein